MKWASVPPRRASVRTLQYTFTVLDSEEINAFTTGGGYVYITRGIMDYLNTEAELDGRARARDRSRHRASSGAPAEQVGALRHRRGGRRHLHRQRRPRRARQLRRRRAGQRLRPRPGARGRPTRRRVPGEDRATRPSTWSTSCACSRTRSWSRSQRAREEKRRAARLSRRLRHATPTTTRACRSRGRGRASCKTAADPRDPERDKYLKTIEGLPVGHQPRAGRACKGNRFYHADSASRWRSRRGWHVENRADRLVARLAEQGQRHPDADPGAAAEHRPAGNSCRACSRSAAPARPSRSRSTVCRATRRSCARRAPTSAIVPAALCGDLLQQSRLRVRRRHQRLGRRAGRRPGVHVDHQDLPSPASRTSSRRPSRTRSGHPRRREHAHRGPGEDSRRCRNTPSSSCGC